MKKFNHLIMIPFTGVGLYKGFRGNNWYKDRIEIFKNYTLKSLIQQTNKNFILWLTFRAEEKINPLTLEIEDILNKNNIKYVFTFDNLMYFDDKYDLGNLPKLLNYGRIIRECWRSRKWRDFFFAIRELYYNKNSTLLKRLTNALNILRNYLPMSDWVYLTRIDSDDMFHRKATEEIQGLLPFGGAYIYNKGYVYNRDTKKLAEYLPKTNPPFHTIIFPYFCFINPQKHLEYYGSFKSHEDIPKIFQTKTLLDWRYCVLTHDPKYHISTIWNHPFRGKIININKKEILNNFGIYI